MASAVIMYVCINIMYSMYVDTHIKACMQVWKNYLNCLFDLPVCGLIPPQSPPPPPPPPPPHPPPTPPCTTVNVTLKINLCVYDIL